MVTILLQYAKMHKKITFTLLDRVEVIIGFIYFVAGTRLLAAVLGVIPIEFHGLLHFTGHPDQPKAIKDSVDVRNAADVPQCFGAAYHRLAFGVVEGQPH